MVFMTESAKTQYLLLRHHTKFMMLANLLSTNLFFSPGFGYKWKLVKYSFKNCLFSYHSYILNSMKLAEYAKTQ